MEGNSLQDISELWGSKNKPYRLVICGGGPAGLSVILRAIRIGMFAELCQEQCLNSDEDSIVCEGICIIDKSPTERFGGGRLHDYVINSNTYGSQFVNVICEEKLNKEPPETISGTCLEKFRTTETSKYLQTFEGREVPLFHVGAFLSEIATSIRDLFDSIPSCKSETSTEVLQVHKVLEDDEGKNTSSYWCIKVRKNPECIAISSIAPVDSSNNLDTLPPLATFIYSKFVVFATGGIQKLPTLSDPNHSKKLMSSDDLCCVSGVEELKMKLSKTSRRKIVIIGGSHSAFSALWICLNKVTSDDCQPQPQQSPQQSSPSSSSDMFPTSSIIILHRGPIRVFYTSRREAEADGCKDIVNIDQHGHVHPFSGLRGDSKVLYQSIRDGRETRARLVCLKASVGDPTQPLPSLLSKLFDEAVVIVWACGYVSNMVPVFDEEGVPIPIRFSNGQVEVDSKARLMMNGSDSTIDSKGAVSSSACSSRPVPIEGLLGTGLGFGLKPETPAVLKGGAIGPAILSRQGERADGVAVYMKRAATLVLAAVLGPKVFGEGASSWEERESARQVRKAQERIESLQLSVEGSGDAVEKAVTEDGLPSKQASDSVARRSSRVTACKSPSKRLMASPATPSAATEAKRPPKLPTQLRSLVSTESRSGAVAASKDKISSKNDQIAPDSACSSPPLMSHSQSVRTTPTKQNSLQPLSPVTKPSRSTSLLVHTKSPVKRSPLPLSHTSLVLSASLGAAISGKLNAAAGVGCNLSSSLASRDRNLCRASTASSRQWSRPKKDFP